MSETYDLYQSVHSIARSVIVNSKALGFHSLDKEALLADVDLAAYYADQAQRYWSLMHEKHEATNKVKAAKTLEIDATAYEKELAVVTRQYDRAVEKMKEIVSGYSRNYNGGWTRIE